MKTYKLFRVLSNGQISPLFINKKLRIPISEWLNAECHPTKGFIPRITKVIDLRKLKK